MAVSGRHVVAAMVPVNIALILWVWVGRGLFGATVGWMMLLALFTAVPVLVATLSVSTVLAYRHAGRHGGLTTAQVTAQVLLWLALLVIGVIVPDVDDNSHEESILINIVGWSGDLLHLSFTLTRWLTVAAVVCWVVLVALLSRGLARPRPEYR